MGREGHSPSLVSIIALRNRRPFQLADFHDLQLAEISLLVPKANRSMLIFDDEVEQVCCFALNRWIGRLAQHGLIEISKNTRPKMEVATKVQNHEYI